MKTKTVKTLYPAHKSGGLELKEAVAMPGIGITIPVRAAKAKLSALLELVARGQEVTITSDGQPKAVLSPVKPERARKVFTGMGDFLLKQPIHGGPSAEELIREDRDSRGW
ncbi:MAG TPA: type II toxin-antitoxin system prevent-host-death family antitoxin [Verrucomicrobiae bacterium]|jgi:prevent-host-death family protein|nr:type II toxin-antitoxin system prevent-host-death family antitoxin [Verrucomicrobiae bacterium]